MTRFLRGLGFGGGGFWGVVMEVLWVVMVVVLLGLCGSRLFGQTTNRPSSRVLGSGNGGFANGDNHVLVATNGAINWPTNFWEANSNRLNLTVSNAVGVNVSNAVNAGNLPSAGATSAGFMTSNQFSQLNPPGRAYHGGLPMVVNTWGLAGTAVAAADVTNIVHKMETNGFAAAGWNTVVIDEGWLTVAGRDSNGNLIGDPTKFPSGISNLCAWVHSKGLRFGLYHALGTNTETSGFKGSQASSNTLGYTIRDAQAMAYWGVDYVKLNAVEVGLSDERNDECQRHFINAFRSTGRDAYFWLLGIRGQFQGWYYDFANDWRGSLTDGNAASLSQIFANFNTAKTNMSQVGNGHSVTMEAIKANPTVAEGRTVMSLWAALSAQGITDVPNWGEAGTNAEVIAAIKDWCYPPYVLTNFTAGSVTDEILVKPACDGVRKYVVLINQNSSAATFTVACTNLGVSSNVVVMRDLTFHTNVYVTNGNLTVTLGATSARVWSAGPGMVTDFAPGKYYISDLGWAQATNDTSDTQPPLRNIAANGAGLRIAGTNYSKGIGFVCNQAVTLYLGGNVESFHGLAGIAFDSIGAGSSAKVIVYGDGTVLADTGALTTDSTDHGVPIDVGVRGYRFLTIVATNLDGSISGNDRPNLVDAYITVAEPNRGAPIRVPMALSNLSKEGTWGTLAVDETTPGNAAAQGLIYYGAVGSGQRLYAGLPVYTDKQAAVHRLVVQATNVAGLDFTNTFFYDMGAGPTSTRHYTTQTPVWRLTNGINVVYLTNSWTTADDLARWFRVDLGTTTSNSTSKIFLLGWDVTFQ